MRRMLGAWAALAVGMLTVWAADPPPFVSSIFGDYMVLQRGKPNAIWGWSQAGDRVTVEIAGKSSAAVAGPDGKWMTRIEPPPPGGPYTVKITGRQTVELHEVLVGDVWLCSGQSNMGFGLGQARNGADEVKNANHPEIRFFNVRQKVTYSHVDAPQGTWKIVSPTTVGGFGGVSAVAYFFARRLQESIHVPIGLVHASVGGVPAETFASAGSLKPLHDFDAGVAEVEARAAKGGPEYGNYIMHWYDEYDAGSKGGSWADPELDDSAWKAVAVPGAFEELGVAGVPSLVWLRKEITLPARLPQGPARLYLGPVEKMDTTFVNGRQVGASSWVENPRVYFVGQALKPGRNVVAVRLLRIKAEGGGFLNPAADLKLVLGDGTAVPLGGGWKGKVAVDARPPHPLPPGFENLPTMPGVLYRGMIAPLEPLAISGAIWYQGESNTVRAFQYRKLLPAMIAGWRESFGQGDFPFYIAGLPAFQKRKEAPGEDSWAEFREAQAVAAKAAGHACVAITIDTGDPDNIHPVDKREVGDRLALCALAGHYGEAVAYSGPVLAGVERSPGALRLRLAHAKGGLVVKGERLEGFAIAGEDRQWRWAEARVEGDSVVLSSAGIAAPVAARYAWQSNPPATLWNAAGLPAGPFRTDDWPLSTEGIR
ncbi:MAG: hypothetical protein JSU00_31400 [Acidobacteria bacterium]|nr:hypothetical protein [Acidobacteriota bacterium]